MFSLFLLLQIAVFKGIPFGKYNERFGDPEPFGKIHTGKYCKRNFNSEFCREITSCRYTLVNIAKAI